MMMILLTACTCLQGGFRVSNKIMRGKLHNSSELLSVAQNLHDVLKLKADKNDTAAHDHRWMVSISRISQVVKNLESPGAHEGVGRIIHKLDHNPQNEHATVVGKRDPPQGECKCGAMGKGWCEVVLLPALPTEWDTGKVTGLRTKCGLQVRYHPLAYAPT